MQDIEKIYVANYDLERRDFFNKEYQKTDIPYLIKDEDFFSFGYNELTVEKLKILSEKFNFNYTNIIEKVLKRKPGFYSSTLRYLANWLTHLSFLHDAINNGYKYFMVFEDNIEACLPELANDLEHFLSLPYENAAFKMTLQLRSFNTEFNFINMHDINRFPIYMANATAYKVNDTKAFKAWINRVSSKITGCTFDVALTSKKELPIIIHKNYFIHSRKLKSQVSNKVDFQKEDFEDLVDPEMIKFMKTFEKKYKKLF